MSDCYASVPGPCPYLTRPTLMPGGKVRELSLTDFSGSFLIAFFYGEDFSEESTRDIAELNSSVRRMHKHGCELLAISADSPMVHSQWTRDMRSSGSISGNLALPLMSDPAGLLASSQGLWDSEEGLCARAVLLVDERGVMRHLAVTSLEMEDILDHSLELVASLKKEKADKSKADSKGLLDKIWRKNIKLADSPRNSLVRSSSRSQSKEGRDKSETRNEKNQGDKRSRSRSNVASRNERIALPTTSGSQERGEAFADTVISSLGELVRLTGRSELCLPEYSSGEVTLLNGKVRGLSKMSVGEGAGVSMGSRTDVLLLSFNIAVKDLQVAYRFKGRRVQGELTCVYDRIEFSLKLSQKMRVEVGASRPELVLIQLARVEGVRMDVTGFGPLNWIAGKKVSELVQETVLQEVEDEIKAQMEVLLGNLGFYFQLEESSSPNLSPIGIIAY